MGMVIRDRKKIYIEYVKEDANPGQDIAGDGDDIKAWFGNELFDARARQWRHGAPKRIKLVKSHWLWYILACFVVLVVAAFLLNLFHPGSASPWFPIP